MKRCSSCKKDKALTDFYKNRSKADGLQNECKICVTARNKVWREKNPEKVEKYQEQYRKENAEQIKATADNYRETHREDIARKARERYDDNREEVSKQRKQYLENNRDEINRRRRERYATDPRHKEKSREWRRNNPDKVRASYKRNYEKHKEKRIAYIRQWQKDNGEYWGLYTRVRGINKRAEKWGLEGRLTVPEVAALLEDQDARCKMCSREFGDCPETRYNIDHIIPMGLGGANSIDQCQLLCEPCHDKKNAIDVPRVNAALREANAVR